VYDTELKNIMERFIQQHIKDRTECFSMTIFHAENQTVTQEAYVWNWLKLFLLYLHMGADRIRFMTYLTMDGG
jgi:hypothetical protein